MKKILSAVLTATLLLALFSLSSCQDSDAKDLLASVPESAQMVTLVNLDKMAKDIDLKTEGDKVILNKQLKSLANGADDPFKLIENGGIKLSYVVLFYYKDKMMVTGWVGNQDAFCNYFEKVYGGHFSKEGKLQVLEEVVTDGERFWIIDSRTEAAEIAGKLKSLSEKNSMAATKGADFILDKDCDITGLINSDLIASANPQVSLSMQMMGGMEYLNFTVRFEEGQMAMDAYFLNDKFEKVSNSAMPMEKINMGTVKMLKGNMQMVMAMGLKKGFLGKLADQTGTTIPGINGVAGTLAVGVNPTDTQGSGLPAAMLAAKTTSPDDARELGEYIKSMLSTGCKVSVKGQTLLVRTANLDGNLSVGKHLSDLEGAYFGVIVSPELLKKTMPGNNIPFEGGSLTIRPDNDSFKIESRIYSTSKANSLMTLLKIAEAYNRR